MNSTTYRYNLIKILVYLFVFMFNQTYSNSLEILSVSPNFIFVLILCSSLVETKIQIYIML